MFETINRARAGAPRRYHHPHWYLGHRSGRRARTPESAPRPGHRSGRRARTPEWAPAPGPYPRPDRTRAGRHPRCHSRTAVRYVVLYMHPDHARGSTSAHLSTDCPPPIHDPSTANPPTPATYPPRPPRKSTEMSTVPICSGPQPNRTTTSCVLVLTDHGARRILRGSLDPRERRSWDARRPQGRGSRRPRSRGRARDFGWLLVATRIAPAARSQQAQEEPGPKRWSGRQDGRRERRQGS